MDGMNESCEPEDIEDNQRQRRNSLLPEPERLRIEAAGLFRRAQKAEEKNKALTAERDHLRAEVDHLTECVAAEKERADHNFAAGQELSRQRRELRAEVEQLRGGEVMGGDKAHICGDPFGACDAECMEKAMMTEAERSNYYQRQMRTWREAALSATADRDLIQAQLATASHNARHYADRTAELEAHVEDLRGALEEYADEWSWGHTSGSPLCHWFHGNGKPCLPKHKVDGWVVAHAALARTPPQSLGRIKAEALRTMARENITLTCRDLEAEADRLDKEASNG
jgi:cell division protein FtsB